MPKESTMKNPIFKLIELTGTSSTSIEDAMIKVVQRAHRTIKSLCWFEVLTPDGDRRYGSADRWMVTVKVGFTVDD